MFIRSYFVFSSINSATVGLPIGKCSFSYSITVSDINVSSMALRSLDGAYYPIGFTISNPNPSASRILINSPALGSIKPCSILEIYDLLVPTR